MLIFDVIIYTCIVVGCGVNTQSVKLKKNRRIVLLASPRAAIEDEVSATSFSWPRLMMAGGQFSPSPSFLPTDRVQSVYSS